MLTWKFFVVYCKADEDVDRNDVDFPEILIAMIRQLASQLMQQWKIKLAPGLFRKVIEKITAKIADLELDKLELSVGLLKIAATMKSSPDARRLIRSVLEPDTATLITAANDVISEAIKELSDKGFGGGLVVLIDDLDKMVVRAHDGAGCSTDEYLFVGRAAQLTAFHCHVIYTMPLSLAYSHQEANIKTSFGGDVPVIPMTKVRNRPPNGTPYEKGIALFRKIIDSRLEEAKGKFDDLFSSEEVAKQLILLSGGQPYELMHLVREALITEMPITENALQRAKKMGQREYARQLLLEHWRILQAVRADGRFDPCEENERTFRELLNSRAILQYDNDEDWYGLNPMIVDLVPPNQIKVLP